MMNRMMANFDFFLAHEIRAIGGYVPDIPALRASPSRIGDRSRKRVGSALRISAAVALAERLGIEPTGFEGGHGGAGASDETFAQKLHWTLRGS